MDYLQLICQEKFPTGASPNLATSRDRNSHRLEQANDRWRNMVVSDNRLKNQFRDGDKVDPAQEGPLDLAHDRELLARIGVN